jgi:hypothetical protein
MKLIYHCTSRCADEKSKQSGEYSLDFVSDGFTFLVIFLVVRTRVDAFKRIDARNRFDAFEGFDAFENDFQRQRYYEVRHEKANAHRRG